MDLDIQQFLILLHDKLHVLRAPTFASKIQLNLYNEFTVHLNCIECLHGLRHGHKC